jgi:hypothetical protein
MHRRVKNQRLASAGYVWAFAALTASPGARPTTTAEKPPETATSPLNATSSTSWSAAAKVDTIPWA